MLPGSAGGGALANGCPAPPPAAQGAAQQQPPPQQQQHAQAAGAAAGQQDRANPAGEQQVRPQRHAAISGVALAFNRAGGGGLEPACIPNVVVALEDAPAQGGTTQAVGAAEAVTQQAQQAQPAQQVFPSPVSVTGTGTTAGTGTTSSSGPSSGGAAPGPAAPQHGAAVRLVVYDSAGLQLAVLDRHADSQAAIGAPCEVPHDPALQLHVWDSAAGWWLLFPDTNLAEAFRSESGWHGVIACGLLARRQTIYCS